MSQHSSKFTGNKQKTHAHENIKSNHKWNFSVDYNDHFETPLQAYEDINVIIELLSSEIAKSKTDLCIYDPYFCKGKMVEHLNSLGYANVINRNADFYSDISKRRVPGKRN